MTLYCFQYGLSAISYKLSAKTFNICVLFCVFCVVWETSIWSSFNWPNGDWCGKTRPIIMNLVTFHTNSYKLQCYYTNQRWREIQNEYCKWILDLHFLFSYAFFVLLWLGQWLCECVMWVCYVMLCFLTLSLWIGIEVYLKKKYLILAYTSPSFSAKVVLSTRQILLPWGTP